MAGTQNAGSIVYEVDMELEGLLRGQRQVNESLSGMNRGFDSSSRSINNAERSAANAGRTFSSLSKVAAAVTAAISVQQIAQYADAWITVNNKLVNAIRPHEQLADVTQRVFEIAQRSRASLEATATLYGRLERATRSAGTSTADLARLTETINKGLVVSGATAEEASSTMIQLSQALASGVLRGEEFNSISENGSRLAVALSDSLGVTVGQLRAMAAQGKLTTDVVVKGLLSQSDQIAKEFANTSMTLGQAFAVATNNVTKFVGESSTIKSVYSGTSSAIVSLSSNLESLSLVFALLAGVMGGRFIGAMTAAAAAQLKGTLASIASAKAAAESAAASELEASAKLRLAEADKNAAVSALNLSQARLNVLKSTNAESVAEVQLAEAQSAQIRTQLAQIESEKALEVQRLKAQISDNGRIATATRMAELQQASVVLTNRLAASEATAQTARSSAIQAAESQVSAARLATADATGVATAANGRYIISQEAATAAARAASVGMGALRGALGLLGGPAGAAMIAAAAVYYFWQKSQQAKQESIDFADKLGGVIERMKEMNQIQLQGTLADVAKSISAQREKIEDLTESVKKAQAEYDEYITLARKMGIEHDKNNGLVIKAGEAELTLLQRRRDLDNASAKLSKTLDQQGQIQDQLNQKARDSDEAFNILANNLRNKIPTASEAAITAMAATMQALDALKNKAKGGDSEEPKPSKEAEKLIKNAERRLALSKLEGEARARLQAQYDAEDAGIEKGDKLIGVLQQQYAETERNTAARKENTKESKANASAQESIAQKLANLKQQSELSAGSTKELSREQSILNAQQSLGKGATKEQIALAGQYAAAKWDTANAIKAQAAAEKLLPENAENARYKQDVEDLNTALAAKKISQEQYNATSEQLEQQHQVNLAKIRAQKNANVTPVQDAQGGIDPVQQLANQHATELAMIQQFESEKGKLTQRGIELANAANTQYEHQRIAAQWEIWKNQNSANELLAAGFDSLAGNASNAFTGILTGSMSAQEAMQSLANNALNSLINGFVQMGVEWVKSAITGSAAQISATAATTSAAVAGTATTTAASVSSAAATTAAWTPAAIVASIGSFGGAAAIGIGAVIAAMAMSGSIAGKRKNGGPIQAGGMYQVGEGDKPEIFRASNGSQYMVSGDNGTMISNKDLQGGGAGGVVINIQNYTPSTVDAQAFQGPNGITVDVIVADINNGGPISQSIQQNHQAPRKARG